MRLVRHIPQVHRYFAVLSRQTQQHIQASSIYIFKHENSKHCFELEAELGIRKPSTEEMVSVLIEVSEIRGDDAESQLKHVKQEVPNKGSL